jgi:hypothetical protein
VATGLKRAAAPNASGTDLEYRQLHSPGPSRSAGMEGRRKVGHALIEDHGSVPPAAPVGAAASHASHDATRGWLVAVGLAALLGVAAAWTDVRAGGLEQTPVDRAVNMILNAGATWAGLAVLAGWLVRRPWWASALAGGVVLLVAVAGYYGYGLAAGDRTGIGLEGLSGTLRFWLLASVTVGPWLGIVGTLIARPGIVGLIAALVVPVGIFVEQIVVRRLEPDAFTIDAPLAWTGAALVVAAAVLGIAALGRYVRSRPKPPTP